MMCGYVTGLLQFFLSNQVFSEDLNSNTVSKLFILVWSYEGMKLMNFGY